MLGRKNLLSRHFAPPRLEPAPVWLYWHNRPHESMPEHYTAHEQHTYEQQLRALIYQWNRQVPSKFKRRFSEQWTFETFLSSATKILADPFFKWLEACVTQKLGIFLDG